MPLLSRRRSMFHPSDDSDSDDNTNRYTHRIGQKRNRSLVVPSVTPTTNTTNTNTTSNEPRRRSRPSPSNETETRRTETQSRRPQASDTMEGKPYRPPLLPSPPSVVHPQTETTHTRGERGGETVLTPLSSTFTPNQTQRNKRPRSTSPKHPKHTPVPRTPSPSPSTIQSVLRFLRFNNTPTHPNTNTPSQIPPQLPPQPPSNAPSTPTTPSLRTVPSEHRSTPSPKPSPQQRGRPRPPVFDTNAHVEDLCSSSEEETETTEITNRPLPSSSTSSPPPLPPAATKPTKPTPTKPTKPPSTTQLIPDQHSQLDSASISSTSTSSSLFSRDDDDDNKNPNDTSSLPTTPPKRHQTKTRTHHRRKVDNDHRTTPRLRPKPMPKASPSEEHTELSPSKTLPKNKKKHTNKHKHKKKHKKTKKMRVHSKTPKSRTKNKLLRARGNTNNTNHETRFKRSQSPREQSDTETIRMVPNNDDVIDICSSSEDDEDDDRVPTSPPPPPRSKQEPVWDLSPSGSRPRVVRMGYNRGVPEGSGGGGGGDCVLGNDRGPSPPTTTLNNDNSSGDAVDSQTRTDEPEMVKPWSRTETETIAEKAARRLEEKAAMEEARRLTEKAEAAYKRLEASKGSSRGGVEDGCGAVLVGKTAAVDDGERSVGTGGTKFNEGGRGVVGGNGGSRVARDAEVESEESLITKVSTKGKSNRHDDTISDVPKADEDPEDQSVARSGISNSGGSGKGTCTGTEDLTVEEADKAAEEELLTNTAASIAAATEPPSSHEEKVNNDNDSIVTMKDSLDSTKKKKRKRDKKLKKKKKKKNRHRHQNLESDLNSTKGIDGVSIDDDSITTFNTGSTIWSKESQPVPRKKRKRANLSNNLTCDHCQTETSRPKFCSDCGVALYCSKDCQTKAWHAGHQTQCSRSAIQKLVDPSPTARSTTAPPSAHFSNDSKIHLNAAVDPKKFICWSCDVVLQRSTSTTAKEVDNGTGLSTLSRERKGTGSDHGDTSENTRPTNFDTSSVGKNAFCIHPHPLLHVTTCSPCADRAYAVEDDIMALISKTQTTTQEGPSNLDTNTMDHNGNEMDSYCSWCVGHAIVEKEEDTDLMLCDTCPRAFCKRCTALAHGGGEGGRKIVEGLLNDDGKWSCIFCEVPYALECMQSLLRDNQVFEEKCIVDSANITNVEMSNNSELEDDSEIAELIRELTDAEDAIAEAAQMLEEESIERQRTCIHEEISNTHTQLSTDAVNELVNDELEAWIDEWKDYHARNEDIIGTSMDLLDDRGIDPRGYYEAREMVPKKSIASSQGDDPAWKKDADKELDMCDESKNLRKGFFKGAMGWDGNEDYRDLEDLDEDERNEVEEINTIEGTLVLLREIAKKKGKPKLVTEFIANALPKEDRILEKLDINIVDRISTDANDKALIIKKSGEVYSQSIRKGHSCISGRIVRREAKQLSKKKQEQVNATKSVKPFSDRRRIAVEEKESKPRKEKQRIVPQLVVDLTSEIGEDNREEEEEMLTYKDSNLVMATLDCYKSSKKKKRTISVVEPLAQVLKPHQKKGVKFMWDTVCKDIPGLVEQIQKKPDSEVLGCILAHNMGLGKSLQVITLAHMLITHPRLVYNTIKPIGQRIINRILIIVPVNTLENWKAEFNTWVEDKNVPKLDIYTLNDSSANSIGRIKLVEKWCEGGGICLSSNDTFWRVCKPLLTSEKKGHLETLYMNAFLSPGPDMIVLDEAHLMLKNNKSEISKALSSIATRRRISLTGTPMQNNLSEYFRMASWIKPGCLGTESEFDKKYISSVMESLNTDASETVVKKGEKLVEEIWDILAPFVQRLDSTVLANDLPFMQQTVIHVRQTKMQNKLYAAFKRFQRKNKEKFEGKNNFLYQYQKLFPVNNHPGCLLLRNRPPAISPQTDCSLDHDENGTWWESVYTTNKNMDELRSGGKMVLLLQIVAHANLIGDKCVVFSQCLKTLDYIEKVLNSLDWGCQIPYIANLDPGRTWGGWKKDIDYLRIDGSTAASQRAELINTFNETIKRAEKSKLFLISSRAGGIGINLVGANRIILVDSNFNPTIDIQAIYRCYRYGQTKPVYAYRFLTEGTMDEKVYSRSVNKTHLSARVVDQKTVERVFTSDELATIMEHNTWVQCDSCNKWRMLYLQDSETDLPDKWYCEMNENDIPRSRCTAIERDDKWYMKHFSRRRMLDAMNNELTNEDIQYESESTGPNLVDNAKIEFTKRDVILAHLVTDTVTNKKDVTSPSKLISKYYFHDSLSKMSPRKVTTF